jgi:hypothetical protein
LRAVKNNKTDLILALLCHPNFTYPGERDGYMGDNTKTVLYECFDYVDDNKFLETVELIFNNIKTEFKSAFICDFFTAINLRKKIELADAGLKIFAYKKMQLAINKLFSL